MPLYQSKYTGAPIDEAVEKAVINLPILNANVIIGNNGDLYVEKDNNNVFYIKALRPDNSEATIGIYSVRTPERVFNWADILETLSTYAGTSPNGVENCLKVPAWQGFLYDIKNDTVAMRYIYNLPTDQYITLFMNNSGFIGGKLNEARNRNNRETIDALQTINADNTGVGTPVLIGATGQLLIEPAGNTQCYFKPYEGTVDTGTNIVAYCKNLGGYDGVFSWSDICAKFSDKISTSPSGVANCMAMGATGTLVLNTKTKEIEFKHIIEVDIRHHVILFGYYYGATHGRLIDFHNRWVRRDIDKLTEKMENIETGIPDYYMTEIVDTKNKLSVLPADNFNYLVISDIHNSHNDFTLEKLKAVLGSLVNIANSSNIDAVICLGDLIEGGRNVEKSLAKTEIMEIVELLGDCRKPVLFAYGNHDQNAYNWNGSDTEDHYILLSEWVNLCVRPFVNKNDYYAVDFDEKGIRVIVTNTSDYNEQVDSSGNVIISDYSAIMVREEQLDDVCDMLNETNLDVIVCGHSIPTNLLDLFKAFNTKGEYVKSNGTTVSFSEKTNRILLYNFGHHHNEAFEYVSTYDLNMFAASCGSLAKVQQDYWISNEILTTWKNTSESEVERVAGEISEACYYVLSIGNGKINKINFGAGVDEVLTI